MNSGDESIGREEVRQDWCRRHGGRVYHEHYPKQTVILSEVLARAEGEEPPPNEMQQWDKKITKR
jgi:hypothetical protein